MAWILQGNPTRYKIDEYLSHYMYVYWSTPKYQEDFKLGDDVFLWRSGLTAGAVALGTIRELPIGRDAVKYPDAMGDEYWPNEPNEVSDVVVGIELSDVRLSIEDGMVSRSAVLKHSILSKARIIKQPQGTVFHLKDEESAAMLSLWSTGSAGGNVQIPGVSEGSLKLKQHYVRERSRKILAEKKADFLKDHTSLFCELCAFDFSSKYPSTLGEGFIEVHHLKPLSSLSIEKKTTIDDLMLACPNCHRMIHRTINAEQNLELLQAHLKLT